MTQILRTTFGVHVPLVIGLIICSCDGAETDKEAAGTALPDAGDTASSGGDSTDSGGNTDDPPSDSGDPPPSDDTAADDLIPPTPPWTADEVRTRLDSVMTGDWPSPAHLRDTYLSAMSHGDAACPGSTVELTDPSTAMEGCTADSGWHYQGNAVYSAGETPGSTGGSQWWISADFRITDPEGHLFMGGGGVSMSHMSAGSSVIWHGQVYGTWRDEAQTGWLGDGLSSVLSMSVGGPPGSLLIELDGGLGGKDNDVYFDQLTLGASGCDGASGLIGLHDGVGYWYWMDIDCSSCGSLMYAETDLGEICLSLDALSDDLNTAFTAP